MMINWLKKKFGRNEHTCTCDCLTEDEKARRNGTIVDCARPDFVSKPYCRLEVECPKCGTEWKITEKALKKNPGRS